ncbi:MAG: CoA transferase, partial [Chloroflexi bacterium]|nr:CoA transferase [Chloroflexota bacterium]
MEKALEGLLVLDLATDVAGPYCAKLLAGFGADVIKVEPPSTGDPARSLGPFCGDGPDPERSVLFLYLNTAKKGVTLDLRTPEGARLLQELARRADAVVESFAPGFLESVGLGYGALRAANPGLVLTSVTPFGQTGPYRDYQATSIVNYALGGHLYITGAPGREPLQSGGYASEYAAGFHAAIATMAALWDREERGEGQHVDVSIVECMAALHQWSDVLYTHNGVIKGRGGNRHP